MFVRNLSEKSENLVEFVNRQLKWPEKKAIFCGHKKKPEKRPINDLYLRVRGCIFLSE